MSPVAGEEEEYGDENGAPGLHSKQSAHTSDAARCESRQKISAAPGDRCGDAKQNAVGHLLGLVLFDFETELAHDFLKIFPDFALGRRISQQVRGMIGRQHFVAAEIQPLAAKM